MTVKKEDLNVDDLELEEKYVAGERFVNLKSKQVIVAWHRDGTKLVDHHGAKYQISGKAFSAVPESIALELYDDPNYDVLSREEAQKYIVMARKKAEEANKDIIEYNREAERHNKKEKKGRLDLMRPIKRWRHVPGNSPYNLYMEQKAKKAHKRPSKKTSKKKQEK